MKLLRATARIGQIGFRSLERDFLVTGCGCSGTTYVAHLLRANGVAVTHDFQLGRRGIVTNACNGKEVWVYAYERHGIKDYVLMKVPVQEFRTIVRVVRHPLKVIGSALQKWKNWGHIWPHVQAGTAGLDLSDPFSLRNGCHYWLTWNEQLEPLTDKVMRFEDVLADPRLVFSTLGLRNRPFRVKEKVGDSKTSWYPSWDEIAAIDPALMTRMKAKALAYGYTD